MVIIIHRQVSCELLILRSLCYNLEEEGTAAILFFPPPHLVIHLVLFLWLVLYELVGRSVVG